MHQWMKETIAKVFTTIHHMVLTTNAWITENGFGLLGVTLHWIDATWEYQECVLAILDLAGKHNNESMTYILLEIIDKFKFQAKVSVFT